MKKLIALMMIAGLSSACSSMDSKMDSDSHMMKDEKMMDSMDHDSMKKDANMMMDEKKMEGEMMMEEKMDDMSM